MLVLGLALSAGKAEAVNACLGAAPEPPDTNGYNYEAEGENWYHYEHGMQMVEIGNWGQATKEFNYYIGNHLYHRGAWGASYFGFGVMHQKQGNIDAAIDCYLLAVSRDRHPKISVSEMAYRNIGAIYLKKKDYVRAIDNYKKAVEKAPQSGLAHYYLGMSYLRGSDLENAAKESVEAKKLGVTFTALDDGIAKAKNPAAAKSSENDEKQSKPKKKKREETE
jgi:tetratricopeptide (TPR) repeat protein